jgi:hypothetical protein
LKNTAGILKRDDDEEEEKELSKELTQTKAKKIFTHKE